MQYHVTFHCDQAFSYKNVKNGLLQNYKYAYPLLLFEYFALFAASLLVVLTLGNDEIFVVCQIMPVNNFVCYGAFHHINYGLRVIKSTPINDSLKDVV